MTTTHEIVICGAGIAGVSAAYHLAALHGIKNVCLVDERPPLTLTSDNSTECYRNWWPGPGDAMVALMNRSINLMEELAQESHNVFHLNRRGYLYLTADPDQVPGMLSAAQEISRLGAGPLRVQRGEAGDPDYQPSPATGFDARLNGADLLLDPGLIHQQYPALSEQVVAALHVRRAGWFSAQQLGMHLLEGGRANGVKLVNDKIIGVEQHGGRVTGVRLESGRRLATGSFVNAAGPMLKSVGRLMDIELPVYCELHQKAAINDLLGVVPREAPLLILNDPVRLEWPAEERAMLNSEPDMRWLLDELPAGVHTRPEGSAGSTTVLMLWEYHTKVMEPTWPLPLDPQYPEIALRGLAGMLPGLKPYLGKMPRPSHDGGYYTRTGENRPLIGRLPLAGAYIIGALSGFGLMASCAAGELLAAHVANSQLPAYASAFALERYNNPGYLEDFNDIAHTGQL